MLTQIWTPVLNLLAQEAAPAESSSPTLLENLQDKEYLMSLGVKAGIALGLLILTLLFASIVARLTTAILRRSNVDETLAIFMGKGVRWGIMLLAVIACISTLGVDTTSFAAVIAAMGLAVGMALQGTLGNFASGVLLLIFRPFKVGDVVNVSGQIGTVVEIDFFATILDTADNRRVILSNGSVLGGNIENITYHDTRRVDVVLGTGYSDDIDGVRDVLKQVAESVEGRLAEKDVAIVLTNLGASSIEWSVRVWSKTEDYWAVRDRLTRDVKYAVENAGYNIPFNQMDVNVFQQNG